MVLCVPVSRRYVDSRLANEKVIKSCDCKKFKLKVAPAAKNPFVQPLLSSRINSRFPLSLNPSGQPFFSALIAYILGGEKLDLFDFLIDHDLTGMDNRGPSFVVVVARDPGLVSQTVSQSVGRSVRLSKRYSFLQTLFSWATSCDVTINSSPSTNWRN